MTTQLTGMLLAVTCAVAVATPAFAQPAPAQEDIQKLFDAGKYQEVVEKTPADAPPTRSIARDSRVGRSISTARRKRTSAASRAAARPGAPSANPRAC